DRDSSRWRTSKISSRPSKTSNLGAPPAQAPSVPLRLHASSPRLSPHGRPLPSPLPSPSPRLHDPARGHPGGSPAAARSAGLQQGDGRRAVALGRASPRGRRPGALPGGDPGEARRGGARVSLRRGAGDDRAPVSPHLGAGPLGPVRERRDAPRAPL